MPRRSSPGMVEVSTNWLKFAALVAALIAGASATAAKVVRKSDRLDASVTRAEFSIAPESLVSRVVNLEVHVIYVDSQLAQIRNDVKEGSRANRAISCFMAKYPVGLCDDVKTVQQAGTQK